MSESKGHYQFPYSPVPVVPVQEHLSLARSPAHRRRAAAFNIGTAHFTRANCSVSRGGILWRVADLCSGEFPLGALCCRAEMSPWRRSMVPLPYLLHQLPLLEATSSPYLWRRRCRPPEECARAFVARVFCNELRGPREASKRRHAAHAHAEASAERREGAFEGQTPPVVHAPSKRRYCVPARTSRDDGVVRFQGSRPTTARCCGHMPSAQRQRCCRVQATPLRWLCIHAHLSLQRRGCADAQVLVLRARLAVALTSARQHCVVGCLSMYLMHIVMGTGTTRKTWQATKALQNLSNCVEAAIPRCYHSYF
ncbi:hypothetical protein B0H13DRAFT_2342262 [Mycena leptocephala]|nr:hypothetical protein B0H13DRAFT_2342262 [Mycena leptocephala]